ncbi:NADH dehydrogenase subunit 2 (mitochondrion) [Candida oxycetoniae]|uniref:NADH-ubiquinone oxidoreductase chain 2 n=1 Tax=Candida oxycetoniae TaxID=497107 RepID=S5TFU0_9ASCO|nr:NADH dehydrogenase subunit 2 [Candida oxycetoniae]AGS44317.1 NADH dehydrogenase subunit 2 [Candida oxycetoniae]
MLLVFSIILLVFIASNKAVNFHLNRLASIGLLYVLYLTYNCIDLRYSQFTLYNDWFKLNDTNIPLVYLQIILVLILLIYTTVKQRYTLDSKWIYTLVYINLIGLLLFPMVNDLLLLYIIIELQSYSLYIITGIHSKSYNSTRGSMLYFVTGGIASIGILLATYFVYNNVGSCNITDISNYYLIHNYNNNFYNAIDILILALVFKMGLAPLHSWSIAVYNYAPTYITAYISIVAKLSILSWIYTNSNLIHTDIIILVFYASIAVAAYKPLFQINIKTILAYSGILNFGYLLIPACLQDISFYVYLIQYLMTHILIFISLLAINKFVITPSNIWSPILRVNQLIIPNKLLVTVLILCFLSLIGIPPLPGFYGKYYVIQSLIKYNYTIEALSIVIFSVIATYYYAFIIKQLASNYNLSINKPINRTLSLTISTLVVIFILYYTYLSNILEVLSISIV